MISNRIAQAICAYVTSEGSGYGKWYCGIAADPVTRLFNGHMVPKENSYWIYDNAGTEQCARDTEAYLLDLGFKGDVGGGDCNTVHVYAYKILSSTIE